MTEHHQLRNALLKVEPQPPARRDHLQMEIQNMLIRKLSTPRRVVLTIIAIADFAAAILCGSLVITEVGLPWMARTALAMGVIFALAWGAWFVHLLRRGEMNVQQDGRTMARMVLGFTLLMVVAMVLIGATTPDRSKGVIVIVQSLVFLISGAVYWLTQRIEDAELNVTERLLRIEMQLAELMQARNGTV